MNYSFKDFATQFDSFTLPVGVLAVAKPQVPTISLRQLMSQGAPYAPGLTGGGIYDSPGVTAFFWTDAASLPPWDTSISSGSASRIATSWLFELWAAGANNAQGAQLASATINRTAADAFEQIQYDYQQELNGNYFIRITAYNNYGSASTGVVPVAIAPPPGSPTITVSRPTASSNGFVITGSGFQAGAKVSFEVDGGATYAHSLSPAPANVTASPQGSFATSIVNCQSLCTTVDGGSGGGGALRFDAIVSGSVVAQANATCVAT